MILVEAGKKVAYIAVGTLAVRGLLELATNAISSTEVNAKALWAIALITGLIGSYFIYGATAHNSEQ